jgi:ferredoxin
MRRRGSAKLRVDWQACEARGLCRELLPELITLDDWGYPIVSGAVPAHLFREARTAVRACPKLALSLERGPRSGS